MLLAHADAVADRLELARTQLAEIADEQRARLRIGAFPSALATIVPRAAAEPAGRGRRGGEHRGAGRARAARAAARRRRLPGRGPAAARAPGTERRDLLREPFLVALWPGHPLAQLETVTIADLEDEPWVAPSDSGMIAAACRAAGYEMRVTMISRDPLANRELIAQGLAVTLVPRLLSGAFTGVELRPVAGPAPERDVYALLPPGERHPLTERLLESLTAVAEALGCAPA